MKTGPRNSGRILGKEESWGYKRSRSGCTAQQSLSQHGGAGRNVPAGAGGDGAGGMVIAGQTDLGNTGRERGLGWCWVLLERLFTSWSLYTRRGWVWGRPSLVKNHEI